MASSRPGGIWLLLLSALALAVLVIWAYLTVRQGETFR